MSQGPRSEPTILVVGVTEGERRRELARALEGTDLAVRHGTTEALWPIDDAVACVVLDGEAQGDDREVEDDTVETVASIRRRRPDLPVVLLAPDDARLAGDAVAAGASALVPRSAPDTPAVVRERVNAVLEASPAPQAAPSEAPTAADGGSTVEAADERRLKDRAMDEAPVGITIADADRPDTPLIYANAAFERVTGYPLEEVLGRNCRFLQGAATEDEPVRTLRAAIESEQSATVELQNYRKDGEPFWNEVTIAPVRDPDGDVTHYVGFQNDVTDRKEAELALERERRQLDHLLDRVSGLLESVHGDLVEATNRDAIETAVCGRIAEEAVVSGCWIVSPDAARNALEVTAGAGTSAPPADGLSIGIAGDAPDADRSPLSALLARAFESGRVAVLDDQAELTAIAGAQAWAADDLAGLAAIPLTYRDTCYGVLTVATTDADALHDREIVVLESIGRATATAINAIERGRLLSTDAVTEIEFEVREDDLFLLALSAHLAAAVSYEGGVFHDDGTGRLFCTVSAPPEDVRPAIDALDVDAAVVTEHEDSTLIAVSVGAESIVGRLAERGATVRSMVATEGSCTLTVEVSAGTDARAVVSTLEERYPTVELRSFRERDRPPATRQSFVADLRERLTDRQRTAITVAYVSGFYEWNREVSGEELAESMGITRSTFHQHRRAAERKLIGAVVDG
jgi:PAS domain S-box-containing protein